MTAVVLHFGAAAATNRCLASLAASDYPALSVLVVDNSAGDDWRPAAGDRPLEVLRPPRNLGFAAGSNIALERLLCGNDRYALLLNNDAVVEPQAIAALVRCAESDARIALVGAQVRGGGVQLDHRAVTFGPYLVRRDQPPATAATDTEWVSGCCLLVRLAALARIGLLDDAFFLYGEDVDWCLRARRAGWRVVHEPRAVAHHDADPPARPTARRAYFLARNAILLARKHGRPGQRAATLAACAALPLLSTVRRVVRREPLRPALWVLRGVVDGVLGRPPRLGALGLAGAAGDTP